jgi:YesN/AraC family two-component response regulator
MNNLIFDFNTLIKYHWCGKFQSVSDEWIHLTRELKDYELIVVTEGVLHIADSKNKYTVNKGEYLIMKPDLYQHGFDKSYCSFYWLHFDINELSIELLNSKISNAETDYFNIPLTAKLSYMERVIVLMKQLQDSDKTYHNILLNNSLSASVIAELSSQICEEKKSRSSVWTKQIFNDISDYIKYHSGENIKVSQIASYFGYNEKYLTTFFKQQSGISLKQFILKVKMDLAKAQLSDTNNLISQIAYNVGFNDAHNFANAFKKITGLSPSEYRLSYGKRSLFYK